MCYLAIYLVYLSIHAVIIVRLLRTLPTGDVPSLGRPLTERDLIPRTPTPRRFREKTLVDEVTKCVHRSSTVTEVSTAVKWWSFQEWVRFGFGAIVLELASSSRLS